MNSICFTLLLLCLISLLIQFFFIVGIFSRLLFFKEKLISITQEQEVSVIIAARNEYENLQKLIPALLNQHYTKYEIIIINDRSTDDTSDLLKEFSEKYAHFSYLEIDAIPPNTHPKKYALSEALKIARYDIILLTDADCLPQSSFWIRKMQEKFSQNIEIVLGFSPYFKKKGFLNAFIQFETLYTAIQYFSFALAGLPYMGVGRNLAYKKSLFLESGGFAEHQNISGGDDDLFINRFAKASNTAICLGKESYVYSYPKEKFKDWYRQKLRHLSVGKYYKNSTKVLLGLLNLSHIVFYLCLAGLLSFQAFDKPNFLIIAGFLLRLCFLGILFSLINRKINAQLCYLCIPVFDILFGLYIFILGLSTFTTKQVQWKN